MKKITLLLILLLSINIIGCIKSKSKNISKLEEEKAYVKAEKVSKGSLSQYIRFAGDIHGEDEATVYPKATGILLKNTVTEGEFVRKGSIIALIDRNEVGYKFNKYPVESPLTGIVGRLLLARGETVYPQTPVAIIADIGRVKIKINISEKDLGYISHGQEAKVIVDTYPKEGFIGYINKISPMLDPQTRTCPSEIIVDNTGHRLKPGMFAHVEMKIKEKAGIYYTTQEAISREGNGYYIFIAKNGKEEKRKVTIGLREKDKIELTSGILGNENIITVGKEKLKNGTLIEITNE